MDVIVLVVSDDLNRVHVVKNNERQVTYHALSGGAVKFAQGERELLRHRVPRCRVRISKPLRLGVTYE